MSMSLPYANASNALLDRIKLVLSKDGLALYGEDVAVPTVDRFLGKKRPPYFVWTDPLAKSTSTTGGATSWQYSIEFSLYVYMFATHTDPEMALSAVSHWMNSAFLGISAEATLGGTVDIAIPRMSDSGYDTTPDKKYVVAAELEVMCKVASVCPNELRELVRNAGK